MDEQFELRNDPPKSPVHKPPPASVQGRQTMLFSGMDCLPGQLDLFETDGVEDEAN